MDPRHSPFASLTHEVEDDDSEEYSPQVTNVPYAIALPLEGEMAGRPLSSVKAGSILTSTSP